MQLLQHHRKTSPPPPICNYLPSPEWFSCRLYPSSVHKPPPHPIQCSAEWLPAAYITIWCVSTKWNLSRSDISKSHPARGDSGEDLTTQGEKKENVESLQGGMKRVFVSLNIYATLELQIEWQSWTTGWLRCHRLGFSSEPPPQLSCNVLRQWVTTLSCNLCLISICMFFFPLRVSHSFHKSSDSHSLVENSKSILIPRFGRSYRSSLCLWDWVCEHVH